MGELWSTNTCLLSFHIWESTLFSVAAYLLFRRADHHSFRINVTEKGQEAEAIRGKRCRLVDLLVSSIMPSWRREDALQLATAIAGAQEQRSLCKAERIHQFQASSIGMLDIINVNPIPEQSTAGVSTSSKSFVCFESEIGTWSVDNATILLLNTTTLFHEQKETKALLAARRSKIKNEKAKLKKRRTHDALSKDEAGSSKPGDSATKAKTSGKKVSFA
jgi:hypothetical protein